MSADGDFLPFLHLGSLCITFFSLYALLFLYCPSFFFRILCSPIVFSTLLLLLWILRIGADQTSKPNSNESDQGSFDFTHSPQMPPPPPSCPYIDRCIVGAPLEVIHEAFEGEETAEDAHRVLDQKRNAAFREDSASCNISSWWEWEDSSDDELIEINLEKMNGEVEEDNLIEIDLFPAR